MDEGTVATTNAPAVEPTPSAALLEAEARLVAENIEKAFTATLSPFEKASRRPAGYTTATTAPAAR